MEGISSMRPSVLDVANTLQSARSSSVHTCLCHPLDVDKDGYGLGEIRSDAVSGVQCVCICIENALHLLQRIWCGVACQSSAMCQQLIGVLNSCSAARPC